MGLFPCSHILEWIGKPGDVGIMKQKIKTALVSYAIKAFIAFKEKISG